MFYASVLSVRQKKVPPRWDYKIKKGNSKNLTDTTSKLRGLK